MVSVRGGGEYGEAWQKAAERTRRQVGLSNLIAAGEYLIVNRCTLSRHLSAFGISGGRMLVDTVTIQRPDLLSAADHDVRMAPLHSLSAGSGAAGGAGRAGTGAASN